MLHARSQATPTTELTREGSMRYAEPIRPRAALSNRALLRASLRIVLRPSRQGGLLRPRCASGGSGATCLERQKTRLQRSGSGMGSPAAPKCVCVLQQEASQIRARALGKTRVGSGKSSHNIQRDDVSARRHRHRNDRQHQGEGCGGLPATRLGHIHDCRLRPQYRRSAAPVRTGALGPAGAAGEGRR